MGLTDGVCLRTLSVLYWILVGGFVTQKIFGGVDIGGNGYIGIPELGFFPFLLIGISLCFHFSRFWEGSSAPRLQLMLLLCMPCVSDVGVSGCLQSIGEPLVLNPEFVSIS